MAGQRTTFAKLQRERARKAKADAKRMKREGRPTPEAPRAPRTTPMPSMDSIHDSSAPLSPDELLAQVQLISDAFERGDLSDEEFEEKKKALMTRLG